MIICDDQSGSKDLFPYVKRLTADAILTRVDPPFGDFVWIGNGPDEKTLNVAVEYKKFSEFMDSIVSGRLSGHQIIGMCQHYDRRYLLIEGRLRTDRNTGILQEQRGDRWRDVTRAGRAVTSREIEHWLTTIEEQAQFRYMVTRDEYESARWIVNKHSWYTYKGWEEHTALQQFHVQPPPTATFVKPGIVRRVAKELTGIGWDKSISVEAKFKSVREMINANEQSWLTIDGIGKLLSRRIVNEINGVNK